MSQSSRTRKLWDDLVAHNPMLIEIHRFRRRFLTFSGSNTLNSAVLALTLVCYAGLVLVVISGKGEIPPVSIVIFQTGLFTFFAPGMLHGAIAGERERRSWDLLLVAPVSKAQIVAGKFIGALTALAIGTTLFLAPILIAAVTWRRTNWNNLFLAEMVSISFIVAVCALTILISARVRRPFMALGGTLGTLGMLLIVLPMLFAVMLGGNLRMGELLFLMHPFYTLSRIYEMDNSGFFPESLISPSLWGWPQTLMFFALAAVMVAWAANTLNFAENDVKFLPKGHRDA